MLKPYDGYKKTSIPWLEDVPIHWNENRAKNLYKKENREPLQEDEVVTCFRDGQVTLRKNRRITGFTESIKEHGYQHINKGDLVIHIMDAFAGAVGVSDSSGKGTPVYSVCTSKVNINNYFYAYIIREMAKTGFIQSLYRGIRERSSDFRFEVFAMQSLPVPPRGEQDQIVKYLDWQTSKINTLVKAKKKQIELLKEQKQALINKAVTKGLDDTAPMKDSGIEWLGEVPEHWAFMRNKNILIEMNELVGENASHFDLLSLTIRGVILRDVLSGKGKFPKDFDTYKIVKKGNMIFCLFDIDETPRTIGMSSHDGMITGAYDVFKVEKINPYYLYFYYLSIDNIKALKPLYTGLRKIIGVPKFLRIKTPFPPLEEQQAIVTYLEEKTALIDKAIAVIEKEIELVSEYKTSLISSIVTGKVDVRDIIVPEFEVVEDILENTESDDEDEVEV